MTSVPDLFRRAAEAHQAGRWDEAQAGYEQLLAIAPSDAKALGNLGTLHLQRGQLAEGLDLIDRSLAERPDQPDAIVNRAGALAMMDRLDEALAGLQTAPTLAPAGVTLCVQLGDGLRKAGDSARALDAYDTALRWQPDEPETLTNRAMVLVDLGKPQAAIEGFEAVLAAHPDHARARLNLGIALHEVHRFDEALEAFERARACGMDPAVVDGVVGRTLREFGRPEEALAAFERSLAGRSDWVIEIEHGVTLMQLQRLDEAAKTLEAALEANPGNDWITTNLAVVHLAAGRMSQGWALYQSRWQGGMKGDYENLPQPIWFGEEPIEGRTLLLRAEQGLGDTIQFVRYAPIAAARGARVVLSVQPGLVELCRSVEGVAEVVPDDRALPDFDLCCPLMSLPFALGLADIPARTPYLRAPARKARAWAERLGPASRKRVGLVWSGGVRLNVPGFWATNTRRNVALESLRSLARADVEFISLQKGDIPEAELHALKAQGWDGPAIRDVSAELNDFGDTAALIEALDLVIAVDTSTAHLAGALGKPVWILNRYDTCWRWMLDRSDSPWYPTARLFRQKTYGDWTPVIEELAEALQAFAAA